MTEATFATMVCCIDGRTQEPLRAWTAQHFAVDFVDTITEPGVDGVLATDAEQFEAIIQKIGASIDAHGASGVVVAGHHDCAAHPVGGRAHMRDARRAAEHLRPAFPSLPVIAAWVDEQWCVRPLL